jgi:hypothetical protein
MYYVGRRGSLGIAKETVRGQSTTPSYWIPYNSISFDENAVVVDSEGAFGQIADSYESYVTKRYAEGEFEYDLDDKAIGAILCAVAGAAPVSTGSTNYSHAFSLSNTNQHQSLSLLVQDPNLTKMFRLGMVDKFSIKIDPEGLVKCTVGFRSTMAQDYAVQTAVYSALGNKFIHTMAKFKIAADIAGLSAATSLNLKSFELNITKNIEDFQDLGTATPSDILNKQLQVEGSFEIGFNDDTYRQYVMTPTNKAIDLSLTFGTNNSLQIQMPKIRFANWEPNKGINDIASEKIEFKALYDVTNSLQPISTLVLKNQVASY